MLKYEKTEEEVSGLRERRYAYKRSGCKMTADRNKWKRNVY